MIHRAQYRTQTEANLSDETVGLTLDAALPENDLDESPRAGLRPRLLINGVPLLGSINRHSQCTQSSLKLSSVSTR